MLLETLRRNTIAVAADDDADSDGNDDGDQLPRRRCDSARWRTAAIPTDIGSTALGAKHKLDSDVYGLQTGPELFGLMPRGRELLKILEEECTQSRLQSGVKMT